MAKSYNSSWSTKRLEINFTQKQWRQDFGEFVRQKKFWDGTTRVTRARVIPNNVFAKGIKQFAIYNAYGGEVIVQFKNYNEVLYTNESDLVKSYFEERGISYERK